MKEKRKRDYFHVSLKDSIATKLLRYVFSVYLIVAIVVTVIHMVSEYQRVKGNIIEDIKIIHLNANPTMAIALWEADKEQMLSILDGMVKSPTILGVKMSDLSGQYVLEKGETIDSGSEVRFPAKGGPGLLVKKKNSDLFGYQFPIIISSKGKRHELGRITIFSSSAVIFSRVQYSYLFIVINAIIKTIVLWIVFLWVSRFLLRRPLYTLTSAAKQIELDNLENIQIDTNSKGKNELTILAETLKDMIQKLLRARKELYENRDQLEFRVSERTAELTEAYTKLKIEEDALKQAKQNADTANRAKSLFLANMSHELRTPLNVILGFSELLARSPNLSSEQLTSLQTIGRSGEHLLALINNVLEFSKIEAGKIELTSERFDLHGFLLGLEEMFRLRAGQKGLALKFILDDDVPTHIRADQNKLRQVLINLLGNAVKFTDEGSITLHGQCREYKPEPSGRCLLRFEVADSGVGISPEDQERIFEAFFQTGGEGSTPKGSGLGLAISHKFVELMGGKLEVESAVGRGTRFTFDLPVELAQEGDEETGRPKGRVIGLADARRKFRLLVAEDDPESRMLLATLLKSVGFLVREAVNGREAVEIWRQWQPHLIWMDIRMPEMDGLRAIRKIRRLQGGEQTVIIGLTAFAFEEDRRKILDSGGDDFVRKPYVEGDIFYQLEKHLGVRFQYAEDKSPSPEDEEADSPERQEIVTMLDALPDKMLSRFDAAIRLSDVAGIEKGLNEIGGVNPRLGRFLKTLADQYAYEEIVRWLDDDDIG